MNCKSLINLCTYFLKENHKIWRLMVNVIKKIVLGINIKKILINNV